MGMKLGKMWHWHFMRC